MLSLLPAQTHPSLRERNFGVLELSSHDAYHHVWAGDAEDAGHRPEAGESIQEVAVRVMQLVRDLDRQHEDTTIGTPRVCQAGSVLGAEHPVSIPSLATVLVSHGDPCQILQAAIKGTDLRTHRRDYVIDTGELRRLI